MFLLDSTGIESIYHQSDISAGFTFFGFNQSQIKNIQGKKILESSKRKKLEFAICYKLFRAVDPVGPSTTLRLGIPTL